jgi:ACR3 family arsenite efflux pump ArsB
MKYFWRISSYLKKHLSVVILVTVVLAIIIGVIFNLPKLNSLTTPLTILIVFPMMIGLRFQDIFSLKDVKVQLITQIVNFALIPFIGYGLAIFFLHNQIELAFGLLLVALLPTSGGMTISWTGFAKGNVQAAIKMTIIGLFLGSLCAPFYINFLMGETISIPISRVIELIFVIVIIPMIVGQLTRIILVGRYSEQSFNKEVKPKLPALSVWGLIGLIFVAIALKAKSIVSEPSIIIQILIPLVLFYSVIYLLSSVVGKFFLIREDAVALVFGTALRSLSIALVMTLTVFGKKGAEIALLISLAYVIQIQSASWYLKLADNIFRSVESHKVIPGKVS